MTGAGVGVAAAKIELAVSAAKTTIVIAMPLASKIKDEFTNLPVSRQRKWALRREKKGLCGICGQKAVLPKRCLRHSIMTRDNSHRYVGSKRSFKNCKTRRLEQKLVIDR